MQGDSNPEQPETDITQNYNNFATKPYTDKTNGDIKINEEKLSMHNNDISVRKIGANMMHEKTIIQPDRRLVKIVDVCLNC